MNILGYTNNALWNEQLSKRYLPATWYVDKETHLPIRQEFLITQVDDVLGQLISSIYAVDSYEMDVAITGFTLCIDYTSFAPVELPAIPDDVLREAWDNAGFSAS